MKNIYEIDNFNKVLDIISHEKTTNNDFHVFRMETYKKNDEDVIIPLHRQHFLDITLFVEAGDGHEAFFDNVKQNVSTHTLVMVPPFKLISYSISKETLMLSKIKGYKILFSFDFLSIGLNKSDFLNDFSFFNITTNNTHFNLSYDVAEKFIFLFEKLLFEYENNHYRSKQILQGYLWVMLNECKKVYDDNKCDSLQDKKIKQPQKLFESFQNLVANNIHGTYAVDDYADMLFITSNHLTQSIKEVSGKSPKEFITERRLIEAKCLLQYTTNTVAEISYLLNFSEPTHFTKFFKKETGVTPIDFRLQT